jgi:TolB-like protein
MDRFCMLAALLASAAPVATAQVVPPAIAILPFSNGGSYGQDKENFDALEVAIPAMLRAALASAAIPMVDRLTVQPLLPAAGTRLDAAESGAIGRRAGARYVISGAFMDHYGRFRIDARIVDVDKAAIIAVVSSDPALQDRRQLFEMIQSVAAGIAARLQLPAPAKADHVVPTDAITLYGRALLSADRGNKTAAGGFLRQALEADARFAEAKAALRTVE